MTAMIERPATPWARGMLCKQHAHSAWVTSDLERAVKVFTTRYGLHDFQYLESDSPQGGHIRVGFAWAGGQILEVIEAKGAEYAFYNEMLPDDGDFAIRFHHLGFIIHDDKGWTLLEEELKQGGWEVPLATLEHNFIDAYYIKAPELGHYLEYVRPFEAGNHFYNTVPAS
ncbi:MAG: hypothetical protein N2Z59_04305 [Alteraurantiacibacter sp.]|nr:hypothetical protein [Alteraurantiacibacter sp.]